MTIQIDPAMPQLALLVLVLVVVSGAIWIAIRMAQHRRWRTPFAVIVAVLALYLAAWLGFAIHSAPVMLAPGDTKCFDEWCATFLSHRASEGSLEVSVRLSNSGASLEHSNLARAFIVDGAARLWPRNPDALQEAIPAHGSLDIVLSFPVPASPDARFEISEGDSGSFTPAFLVIDDEASPWHALTAWPINRAAAAASGSRQP
jgi:hypothetical protein